MIMSFVDFILIFSPKKAKKIPNFANQMTLVAKKNKLGG